MKTEYFSIKKDDKDIELAVKTPSSTDQREGQKVYNRAFTDAIKTQSIVRAKMEDVLREQGLWDDNKQNELTNLQSQVSEKEKLLAKGGIKLKDARALALDIRDLRDKIRDLIGARTTLDSNTAEGQADNARFNYLVSACVVYKNDEENKYFNNLDDYLTRITDPAAIKGAQILANMIYGLDNDYEKNLPENKFLMKYKFVDSDLRFINNDGKFVDKDGRLVDKDGRFVNEQGEFVDRDGNRVDKNGEYIVNHEPFLDDEGKPIEEPKQSTSTAEVIPTEVVSDPVQQSE
jgi:hypothetical protein